MKSDELLFKICKSIIARSVTALWYNSSNLHSADFMSILGRMKLVFKCKLLFAPLSSWFGTIVFLAILLCNFRLYRIASHNYGKVRITNVIKDKRWLNNCSFDKWFNISLFPINHFLLYIINFKTFKCYQDWHYIGYAKQRIFDPIQMV